METFYWYYKDRPNADFVYPAEAAGKNDVHYAKIGYSKQENNIINILNLPISKEANNFQFSYA